MKALQAIGFGKALRFIWYSWYGWLIHISLPPMRTLLLQVAGAHVGEDTVIFDAQFANLYHYGFKKLVIGNRCFVGDGVMLDVRGGITMADDVTISNRASIVTHINVGYPDHPLQKLYPTREAPVIIKQGAYIGTGAIILPGVIIGRQSVVGAGAVVTKHVPNSVVVVGVPARIVKNI